MPKYRHPKSEKGEASVSKKINDAFLAKFKELDRTCCEKFGVHVGGVNEYMSCLNNVRFAPNRDEVLQRLVKYGSIYQRVDYNPQDKRRSLGITKEDVKWLASFKKLVQKKKDPISVYLRKARRFAFRRKMTRILIISLIGALIVAGIALFFILK